MIAAHDPLLTPLIDAFWMAHRAARRVQLACRSCNGALSCGRCRDAEDRVRLADHRLRLAQDRVRFDARAIGGAR